MELFKNLGDSIAEQAHRVAVDVINGPGINKDAPYSPDVPEELRHTMPDLFDRFPLVMPWEKPSHVDPALHNVWLLDNTAFRVQKEGDQRPDLKEPADPKDTQPALVDESGQRTRPSGPSTWEVEQVACYFVKQSGRDPSEVIAAIANKLGVGEDDSATRKLIGQRLEPFLNTILPNRTARILINNEEEQTIGPSSYQGISSQNLQLHFEPPPSPAEGQVLPVQTRPSDLPPPFGPSSNTVFAEEEGWGIISDIDDTIKITQTPSLTGILQTTFATAKPQPVAGMPELYQHFQQTLNAPPFFYLSASPYNLYPFLRQFRESFYPPGTIILRDASWQNLGGLYTSLTVNTQNYKVDRMHKIHAWFPKRRFVCLGDSTQSDPEAYGEIARTFPGFVRAVFIRKVTGIAEMDEKIKNAPERFDKAFKGLDRRLWHVFTEPGELAERAEELVKNPEALVGGE